jgi:AraC-like DNA-binding protein
VRPPIRDSAISNSRAAGTIAEALSIYLGRSRMKRVYFAEDTIAPPVLAYVTHFPRLYIPLSGRQSMEIAQHGTSCAIRAQAGEAVFVPENAWDKPEWSTSTEVLTILFGARQIGISLVKHQSRAKMPLTAVKANIHGAYDGVTNNLLAALVVFAADRNSGPLANLLIESLLHSCLRLLSAPPSQQARKAARTYESVCLYVQENFQHPLSRESVAEHFGLAPNHISRLFRQEGLMRFNDYLNLVRIQRAKFMLRNYTATLKEVAANCGYGEVSYFCRLFKRITKETPSQFRAKSLTSESSSQTAARQSISEPAGRPDRSGAVALA